MTYLILNSLSFFRCLTLVLRIVLQQSFLPPVTHVSLPWLFVAVIALKVKSQTFSNESTVVPVSITIRQYLKDFTLETMINDRDVSLG